MTDFIETATAWISDYRHKHATQPVTVKCTSCPAGVPLRATVSSEQAESNPNGVKLQSQHVHFIIRNADIKKYNILIERGLEITWKNRVFEIAYDKSELWEWNDPHHVDIIIKTVFKKDLICP